MVSTFCHLICNILISIICTLTLVTTVCSTNFLIFQLVPNQFAQPVVYIFILQVQNHCVQKNTPALSLVNNKVCRTIQSGVHCDCSITFLFIFSKFQLDIDLTSQHMGSIAREYDVQLKLLANNFRYWKLVNECSTFVCNINIYIYKTVK